MGNSSYIQTILNAFSLMDIDTLRNQLKDDYFYQDTTKELFLNEIEKLFKHYRNAGDTKLLIYEGKCIDNILSNYGKRGYRFVGNHSGNFINFIFETINSGFMFEIEDVSNILTELSIFFEFSLSYIFTSAANTKI